MATSGQGNQLGTASGQLTLNYSQFEQAAKRIMDLATQMEAKFNALNTASFAQAIKDAKELANVLNGIQKTSASVSKSMGKAFNATQNGLSATTTQAAQATNALNSATQSAQAFARATEDIQDYGLKPLRSYSDIFETEEWRNANRRPPISHSFATSSWQEANRLSNRLASPAPTTPPLPSMPAPQIGAWQRLQIVAGNVRQAIGGAVQNMHHLHASVVLVQGAMALLTQRMIASAERTRIIFAQIDAIAGSVEEAEKIKGTVKEIAAELNAPFLSMLENTHSLIPLARAYNIELRDLLLVANQLTLRNPLENFGGAAVSLNELLTSDTTSIVDRFNLSRQELTRIKHEVGGIPAEMIKGLSAYLETVGVTIDAVKELNKARVFDKMGDEVQQAIHVAFEPLLTMFILPLAKGLSDVLRILRESAPILLQIGGAVIGMVAAVSSLALAFWTVNQAITAINAGLAVANALSITMSSRNLTANMGNAAGAVASAAPTAAVLGGALAIGVTIGKGIMQMVGTKEQNEIPVEDTFGKILSIAVAGLIALFTQTFVRLVAYVIFGTEVVAKSLKYTADLILQSLANALPFFSQEYRRTINAAVQEGADYMQNIEARRIQTEDLINNIEFDMQRQFFSGLGYSFGEKVAETIVSGVQKRTWANTEQLDAFAEFQEELAKIDKDYAEKREKIVADATQREAQLEAEAAKSTLQKIEDYQKSESRRREDYEIARAKNAKEYRRDLANAEGDTRSKIKEIVQSSNKEREKALIDFQKRLADIERTSRLEIINAARSLDAIALFNALRNRQLQIDKLNEERDDRLTAIQQGVAEQVEAERKGLADRLAEIKAKHLQERDEAKAAYELETERRKEDHEAQLRDIQTQLEEQRQEVRANKEKELEELRLAHDEQRTEAETRFVKEFNNLAKHNSEMIDLQKEGLDDLESAFNEWFADFAKRTGARRAEIEEQLANEQLASEQNTQSSQPATSYAVPIPVDFSGNGTVPVSFESFTPTTTRQTTSSTRNNVEAPITINITAPATMNMDELGGVVKVKLVETMRELML